MKTSRLLTPLALALAAAVARPAPAHAQTRPTPTSAATTAVAPAAAPAVRTPIETTGVLSHFLLTPLGRVRGLVLNDHTIVFVHGRGAPTLPSHVTPGARLSVSGYTVAGQRDTIHGATVRDATGAVLVAAPALSTASRAHAARPLDATQRARIERLRAERRQRIERLPVVTASGTVAAVLSTRHGTVDGVVLSDGTTIAVGRRLGRQMRAHGLRAGETLRVTGHGERRPAGESLQAEDVTFADGTTIHVPV
jgi:hypothetical protein